MRERVCECDDGDAWDCDVHVHCDADCGALREPVRKRELRATLEHYRSHQLYHGCSHGR